MNVVLTSESEKSSLSSGQNFLDTAGWIERLLQLPLYKYPVGKLFGKPIVFHRWMGFFSDTSVGYRFSGQTLKNGNLTPELRELLNLVNEHLEMDYNGVLVNVYETGLDYISAHSDNEKEIRGTKVAAISFGSERIFRIRNKQTKKIVLDHVTQDGELLVMDGEFQKEFTHEIPPTTKAEVGMRVSLTFRSHSL
jgi:alkylated DNA repair dioxygenase AlkB